jgi:release factor glutamine methyltransferase
MKNLGEVLRLSVEYLHKRGVVKARRQVEELLSAVVELSRLELYMRFDRVMEEAELAVLRDYLKRKCEGEPWQYIVGEVEFLGCLIEINQAVLIPRQETEILADRICKELPSHSIEIWDVCTGSGCLGIALKKKRPDCHVVLTDISSDALKVARANAIKNQVDVECIEGDLLAPLHNRKAGVIVCNPPYVSEEDYAKLEVEVRAWEPKQALVGGKTGLEFYQRLAQTLPSCIQEGGKVYFEIGAGMGEQVKNLFGDSWKEKVVLKDWSSHDRFIILRA